MNPVIQQLMDIKLSLQNMKQMLMQRKSEEIMDSSAQLEQMIAPLRDSMAVISGLNDEEQAEAKAIINDIKNTSRSNYNIASAFNMLLKSALSSITEKPVNKHTYCRDNSKDAPAAPLLVFQQG